MSAVFGIAVGFLLLLVLTVLSALLMTAASLSGSTARVFSVIILGISALVCGFASAKKLKSKALIIGAVSGLLMYILIAVISAAVTKEGFTSVFAVRLLISVAASSVGAFLSTVSGGKKYI